MNYHDPYFELFRIQTEVIKELEYLVTRMKLVQSVTEEMVIGAEDEPDSKPESPQ